MKWFPVIVALIIGTVPGCTYRAWYTGFQEEQRRRCYDNPYQTEIQQCLDRAGMSYDQYEKQRKESERRVK